MRHVPLGRRIRSVLTAIAERLGYTVTPTWALQDFALASHLRELFRLYGIDTVLDVGANRGQYGSFLRGAVGFEGTIISFEPVSTTFEDLEERSKDDAKWRVMRLALGEASAEKVINIMRSDRLSSFNRPNPEAHERARAWNRVERTETVEVARLDDIYPRLKAELGCSRTYLKMDTQGYDLNVLMGAPSTLAEIVAFQSEVAVQKLYTGTAGFDEVIPRYEGYGFELSGLFPVNCDDRLALVEMDCVMLSRNARPAGDPG